MAGRPIARGRPQRTRQRLNKVEQQSQRLTSRWAATNSPSNRLAVVADIARSLVRDEQYGDVGEIDQILERHATELRRELRQVLTRRQKEVRKR